MMKLFRPLISFSVVLIFIPAITFGQITEFVDDFEDGSLDTTWNGETKELWYTNAEELYTLNELNGVLEIDYNRTSSTGGIFTMMLPEPVDMSDNPRIKLSVRTPVPFSLTLLAYFQIGRPTNNVITHNVPGDGEWHTFVFEIEKSVASEQTLKMLNFYFDQEYDGVKDATINFDNLSVSGSIIEIKNLQATTVDSTSIQLSWETSAPDETSIFRIYRSKNQDFTTGPDNFVTNTGLTTFLNKGLKKNTPYYYRILPFDTLGIAQIMSDEIRQETYTLGEVPVVEVDDISANEYPKYEKVELLAEVTGAVYDNPYNPEDIDMRARFIAPSGDTTHIYGFYDNYQNRQQWKVRFAPTEVGEWKYEVYVIDSPGTSLPASGTFTAVDSDHPGYVQISKENPNYLKFSEGDFYYPMSVYYPWNVTESGLDELEAAGVDFFGYWNGTYDNAGNGGGNRLIESMDSGLGRYDQYKSARIDQLIEWAEARNMRMMLAIWAHPFVRDGAPGWDPIDWPNHNPYQEIIEASEFYTDSLAWTYQKKNFRYVVARWGYSRALGIWEIMNEVHGTTGYVEDAGGAYDWISRSHDYLKELDPYDRPTTASFDGADAFNIHGVRADMPNIHYYELQGYPRPYGNNLRDGLYNIVDIYEELKETENRPAFLGEAGYTSTFTEVGTDEYAEEFHNAFWAGLANGIATTPFWWDYTTRTIFTDLVMEQYGLIKKFADSLNLSEVKVQKANIQVPGSYAYAMEADSMAFGWFWSYEHEDISNLDVRLRGLPTQTYTISWYNTWTGETISEEHVVSINEVLSTKTPEIDYNRQDLAFKIHQSDNGTEATSLNILFHELIAPFTGDPEVVLYFAVYLTDENGRLVETSGQEISLSLDGEGTLQYSSVTTENGYALFQYVPENGTRNPFTITASADGLTDAVITENVVTSNENSDETEIPSRFELYQNYPNPFNPTTVISYQLSENSEVRLDVFDITGRKVANLVNERKAAGFYETTFNANGLSSGVYFYTLKAGDFEHIKKMVLVK